MRFHYFLLSGRRLFRFAAWMKFLVNFLSRLCFCHGCRRRRLRLFRSIRSFRRRSDFFFHFFTTNRQVFAFGLPFLFFNDRFAGSTWTKVKADDDFITRCENGLTRNFYIVTASCTRISSKCSQFATSIAFPFRCWMRFFILVFVFDPFLFFAFFFFSFVDDLSSFLSLDLSDDFDFLFFRSPPPDDEDLDLLCWFSFPFLRSGDREERAFGFWVRTWSTFWFHGRMMTVTMRSFLHHTPDVVMLHFLTFQSLVISFVWSVLFFFRFDVATPFDNFDVTLMAIVTSFTAVKLFECRRNSFVL